jgi:ABC-type antimicrobial peptide transport system permease subunit
MNVVQGRNFTEEESRGEANVAIISRSVAEAFWPASNAIGQSLHIAINRDHRARVAGLQGGGDSDPDERELQVIGIVPDQLTGFVAQANGDRRSIYLPLKVDSAEGDLLIRIHGDAEVVRRQLEAETSRRVPGAVLETQSAEDIFQAQFFPFTVMFQIATTIGIIALAMAGAGIFGFVSFLASQRTKEIGIRMALGASRSDVRLLVVQQVMKSSALGLLVGTVLATGASALFAKSIFAMNHAFDPMAYGGAIGVVTAAAALAAFIPARRASSVDPAATLRND